MMLIFRKFMKKLLQQFKKKWRKFETTFQLQLIFALYI